MINNFNKRNKNMLSNENYTNTKFLPETLKMMKDMGIGSTRDKWELDSIPVGGFRLIKASEMPSKNWTGPGVSDSQKASGLTISVRKTNDPEHPIVIIRTS